MKSYFYKFLMVFLALVVAIPPAWATTDVITASDLTATSTTITSFSNVSKSSGAVYAGKTGLKNSAIRFVTNSEAEICTTTSGGKVKSVTIVFNTSTETNRKIDVYGKNAAYSVGAVYSSSTKGTLLGTASYSNGETKVITVSGDYEYIAIRPQSNESYIDRVEIEWDGGTSIEIAPESLTVNDSGTDNVFTITGNGIDGNINASLANNTDWYLNPTSFSNTGGETSVTYTGRALSASNTVTATAANDATITASANVNYVADLYIVTDNGVTGQWDFYHGTHMTNNNGIYTANFTANADNTYILFARKLGDGVNWNTRLVFGPSSNGDWVWGDNTAGTIDLNDDDPIKLPVAGNYSITIDANAGTFSITKVMPQVSTPTFSPAEGTFTEAQTVTISCATDGATISYSTDGGTTWTVGNSLTVSETTTVMAKATKDGMTDSEVATATYTIKTSSGQSGEVTVGDASTYTYQLPAYYPSYYAQTNQMIYPETSLEDMVGNDITGIKFYIREGNTMNFSGTYSVALGMTSQLSYTSATPISGLTAVVTEHEATTGVTEFEIVFDTPFRYDGGNLVVQFQVNNPAPNNFTNTYWAGTNMGYNVGYYSQYSGLVQVLPKATFTYASSIPSVATPTFSPAAGTYNSVQQVAISCATDGATISYSTDGGNTWTPYSGPITVSETTTIMAKAAKDGMTTSEASAEYIIDIPEDYAVTVDPDGGTIDFGTVDNEAGATKSKTITITNTGLNPVTPTLSALSAPFSTEYTPTALQPGESMTITITFAPTEEGTFNGQATLSFGNGIADRSFTLTGKGGQYDVNDHSDIYDHNYTWTDSNGQPHTSSLLETATDPDQIIAMLREVYTNKQIPGNKVRGYTESLAPESLMVNGDDAFAVNYSAVGQLNSSLEYVDQYGWNIPTYKDIKSVTKGSSTYRYMDPTEYTPDEEGVTLIMVELKDGANYSGNSDYYSFGSSALSLRDKVANTFKSARIITTWKHSGSGEEAGTLFKIDADKLNRYFFLAKGQLRLIDHAQSYESTWTSTNVVPFPSLKGSTFTDNTFNASAGGAVLSPFEHMFEQFSPNQAVSSTSAMTDVYQDLVNMESFPVIHDCVSIPYVGGNHEFNMYGVDSESDDCQDVRDMMFFVPDYRMKFWRVSQYSFGDDIRDPNTIEKFVNYNREHNPTLGLYIIRQNEITGEKQADADVYDLNLSWESNLLDFLPGEESEYDLYRVIIDQDGNKTYEWVATIPSGQTTYVDHVDMDATGKVVTYVVQGQDTEHFLSLQMSNEESFVIPGTDLSEIFNLSSRFAHYSRFNPLEERNYYANQLIVNNNQGTYIKGSYLGNGATFTFYRIANNDVQNRIPILTATSNGNGTLGIVESNGQRQTGLYNDWIYMPNPKTVTYTVDATTGRVTFSDFTLYDNFYESVLNNAHPGLYSYIVELEASTVIDDTDSRYAHSNAISVAIHKTDMDIPGYTKTEVDDDTMHQLIYDGTREIDEQVKYSSKTEILRYDVYRWKEDAEDFGYILDFDNSSRNASTGAIITETDMEPTGQAGNQGEEYTVKMDGMNSGSVMFNQDQTVTWVDYTDRIVENEAGLYTYAPVVETFTPSRFYNTYGAPLQQTGVSKVGVEVGEYTINLLSANGKEPAVWEENGNKYCHYTVKLYLTPINVPEGYELYKVRAWRQVDRDLLNEQVWPNKPERNRDYRLTSSGEYMMEEVDYNVFTKTTTPQDYQLGQSDIEAGVPSNQEVRATFGAQKLRTEADETGVIEALPMSFLVRAYYTREANLGNGVTVNGAPRRDPAANAAADGKYYIAEASCDFTFYATDVDDDHTGLASLTVSREVTDVTYYNVMGQSSSKPFSGINIKVTRYSDGTSSTVKVIK